MFFCKIIEKKTEFRKDSEKRKRKQTKENKTKLKKT